MWRKILSTLGGVGIYLFGSFFPGDVEAGHYKGSGREAELSIYSGRIYDNTHSIGSRFSYLWDRNTGVNVSCEELPLKIDGEKKKCFLINASLQTQLFGNKDRKKLTAEIGARGLHHKGKSDFGVTLGARGEVPITENAGFYLHSSVTGFDLGDEKKAEILYELAGGFIYEALKNLRLKAGYRRISLEDDNRFLIDEDSLQGLIAEIGLTF